MGERSKDRELEGRGILRVISDSVIRQEVIRAE